MFICKFEVSLSDLITDSSESPEKMDKLAVGIYSLVEATIVNWSEHYLSEDNKVSHLFREEASTL